MPSRLHNRRIAVLAADGFEKVELTVPVTVLRAAGATVDIVSLRAGRIRGVNLHEPAGRVRVTETLDRANADSYDGLLLPGGFINPDLLRQSAAARAFVRAFDVAGKPIATLCHGPWVLASAGVLSGRTLTSWPGIRDDMVNAGATWRDEALVWDGNLITSRGPQDMLPFVQAMLRHFAGEPAADQPTPRVNGSSPQRRDPPAIILSALKWTPRPSFRTAAAIALLAAGALIVSSRPREIAAENTPAKNTAP